MHSHEHVVLEDLAIKAMTATGRGSVDQPGLRVQQKAGLNRAILDAAFGELRRQFTYKTAWYGARLSIANRWYPSSQSCSACGWRHPNLTLANRLFPCRGCGLEINRDLNAAINLRQLAGAGALPVGSPLRPSPPLQGRRKKRSFRREARASSSAGVRRAARDLTVTASKC